MSKIVYVSPNGYIGGAEKVLINFAKMHAEKKEVAYFLLFNEGILVFELEKLGFKPYVIKNKFKLTSPIRLYKAINEIRSVLIEWDFNIIHSTMAYAHLVMGLATPFMKKRKVWFQHGPVAGILDSLASLFYVDVMLFNSHFLLEKHMGSFVLRRGRFIPKVIPLPVFFEEPKYSEVLILQNELQTNNKIVFGSFGRISRGKNYHLLIHAFAKLNLSHSLLIIMGSPNSKQDETYLKELKALAISYHLQDKVVFISHQNKVESYYKLLNFYIHPGTLDEGFGLTVAEAMFLGVPVISSNYGALNEFVKDNETALVVKSRDKNATELLVSAITRGLSNELETKKISKLGQDNIKAKYNQSNFHVAITDVYQFLTSID
jgi:glycosyltransferase involved in cell wall biosynthesis